MNRATRLTIEAGRTALATRWATTALALTTAGALSAVMLTAGRLAALEDTILSSFDDAGGRRLAVLDFEGEAGLDPMTVTVLGRVAGISTVAGVGYGSPAYNPLLGQGSPSVAVRSFVGELPADSLVAGRLPNVGEVVLPVGVASSIGLSGGIGALRADSGSMPVVGLVRLDGVLADIGDAGLRREPADKLGALAAVMLEVGAGTSLVEVRDALPTLVVARDLHALAYETSENLAQLQSVVAGDLGRSERQLLLGILAAVLAITAVVAWATVAPQRQSYGRRRALGASRVDVLALLVGQFGAAATLGATMGLTATLAWLSLTGQPTPSGSYRLALLVALILTSVVAVLPTAVVTARREPVNALRVP